MARTALTALAVQKLKPPTSRTTRRERYDAGVKGFGVRVTSEGSKSWIFLYTSPTKRKRVRYTIGAVDLTAPDGHVTLNLEQARGVANDLRRMVREGRDPADERESTKAGIIADAQEAEGRTFRAVVERYNTRVLSKLKRGWEVKQILDRELIPHWGDKAIGAITAIDVQERVEALADAGTPAAAHALFDAIRRLFNWAIARPSYRLDRSPAAGLRAHKLIGKRPRRQRVLDNAELIALWRATETLGYPFGQLVRILMLTALRLREAANAQWREFDLDAKLWVVPLERMKGASAHGVPLTEETLAIFNALPRFSGGGDHMFTSRAGKPISGFSAMKTRLDKLMLEELRKIDQTAELAPWVLHDIRRTVRTRLSRLKISEEAREAVLAHVRPGTKANYDVHDYLDEKTEALEQWGACLRKLVDPPPPDNVITLRA
jgi:integrase